jgi:hypothetical protein
MWQCLPHASAALTLRRSVAPEQAARTPTPDVAEGECAEEYAEAVGSEDDAEAAAIPAAEPAADAPTRLLCLDTEAVPALEVCARTRPRQTKRAARAGTCSKLSTPAQVLLRAVHPCPAPASETSRTRSRWLVRWLVWQACGQACQAC